MRGILNRNFLTLRLLVCIMAILVASSVRSQTCTAQFTQSISPTGQVSFVNTSTTVSTVNNYTWTFGAGYLAPVTGTNGNGPTVTYTANGTYVVVLSISSASPSCFTQYSTAITVSLCSLSIFTVAPTGSICNGSGTVTSFGLCGPVSYTWSSGAIGATAGNLCGGTTYSVLASSGSTGNCCPTASTVFTIPANTLCALSANFSFTQSPGGVVNFKSTSTGTTATTSYTWEYGDNTPGTSGVNLTQVSHTYQANGVHTASLFLSNGGSCLSDTSKAMNINSVITCSLNAAFNPGAVTNGSVTLVSSSSGTTSNTTYTWNFGDGKVVSTGTIPVVNHTYTLSGTYFPYVVADNNTNPICRDTSVIPGPSVSVVIITCSLNASFSFYNIGNYAVQFQSTSTNTLANTIFAWNFGDATTGSGSAVVHTYPNSGPYIATLTVSNPSTTCIKTFTALIQPVDTVSCNVKSSFTHTVGHAGAVSYSCTSKGQPHKHFWEFGDGYTAVDAAPTHTYTNSGNHYVKLTVIDSLLCRDSVIQSINITGVKCVANTGFSLQPGNIPHYYGLIPAYPYNIVAARWSWGDGTFDNTLYASHVYSVAGNFSICLSVTVSCGESATSCINYQFINNGGTPGSFSVNVMSPPLKVDVDEVTADRLEAVIYPNPGKGHFNVLVKSMKDELFYTVTDLLGATRQTGKLSESGRSDLILNYSPGLYFIHIAGPYGAETLKIVIED